MPIDYKKYSKDWKQVREKVMTRAGQVRDEKGKIIKEARCELCPAINKLLHWLTGSKVVITIHHINFNHTDNRMINLLALCQRCHIKLDVVNKVDKRKLNNK